MWYFDAAKDPNTPISILTNLIDMERCRLLLAKNPSSTDLILSKLSDEKLKYEDKTFQRNVIWEVLGHPNTSGITIKYILQWTKGVLDKPLNGLEEIENSNNSSIKSGILVAVAGNRNTPSEILESLLNEKHKDTWFYLLTNPAIRLELLIPFVEKLASKEHESEWGDINRVADNPILQMSQLKLLHNHPFWYVRDAVARHPNIDQELLKQMLRDTDQVVRLGAMWNSRMEEPLMKFIAEQKYSDIAYMNSQEQRTYFEMFRKILLQNPTAPDYLKILVKDPYWLSKKV